MKFYKFITLLFINLTLILSISCISTKKTATNDLIIELRTTECSGTCPAFTLQIFSNGEVLLDGKKHLKQIGKFKSKLEKETLNEIINLFDKSNFFEFKDSYKSLYMDLPAKYITYNKNGKSKNVMAYDNIPENLTELINELKQLIDSLEWEKVE